MEQSFQCLATAAFGLEGLVADELRRLHMRDIHAENGGVRFLADLPEIMSCNLRLRCCDRVMMILAEGKCMSFDELFQLVSSVPWEKYTKGDEAFNISAKCARSRLMSPRDCQSIVKKALIERLKDKTGIRFYPESGASFPVMVSIHTDRVRIMLNTSGDALSRRGYRTWNGEAPLRETLAAALVEISPWRPGLPLYDPCCGTGTILVEAAWMAAGRSPGLTRAFALESFSFSDNTELQRIRSKAESEYDPARITGIGGGDIDPEAVRLAERHLQQAGIGGRVSVAVQPLQELTVPEPGGVFICNPPYGERLSDQESCRKLYRDLRDLSVRHPGWALCAISSDPGFERAYGKKADRKRRIYNGRLECTYYIFSPHGKMESD